MVLVTDIEVHQHLLWMVGPRSSLTADQSHILLCIDVTGRLDEVLTCLEMGRWGGEGE